ncbi:MAG: HEAT repeat domain-containing protein [Actinomycetota bacterium]
MAGHTGDVPTVVDALTHDAPEVRVIALGAAARLDILDHDRLAAGLADPDLDVRYRAVELAARVPAGTALADRLIDALDDPGLREVAAFALGELVLTGTTETRAIAALGHQAGTDEDALARESAVAALGALGAGLEYILAATEDVAAVRRRAVLALAPFDGAEVDAALTRALNDRDWQVRQAAEDLLD